MNGSLIKSSGVKRSLFDNLKEKVLKFITSRAVIISGVLILFACVLICKLFVLQIVEGKEHRDSFVQKQNKEKTISATRGKTSCT